jgi:hypothetical protein
MKTIDLLTEEIYECMIPVIKDYLLDAYIEPEKFLDPEDKEATNQLIKFQKALKKVPNWTAVQIKKQVDEVITRCTWFKSLISGLFVAYINRISNSLRINSESVRMNISIPSVDIFVHTCFVRCAHDLYEDPYIMKADDRERSRELDSRIKEGIRKTIIKLVPKQAIIDNRLPSMKDSVAFSHTEPESIATPETGIPPPPIEPPIPEETHPAEEEEEPVKEIPVVGAVTPPRPELFPDAPEDKPE